MNGIANFQLKTSLYTVYIQKRDIKNVRLNEDE
jgi:hypothetical protein